LVRHTATISSQLNRLTGAKGRRDFWHTAATVAVRAHESPARAIAVSVGHCTSAAASNNEENMNLANKMGAP